LEIELENLITVLREFLVLLFHISKSKSPAPALKSFMPEYLFPARDFVIL
jgi:hypothetical protein